jgi:DNA-binding MarR family transcriptional regulator
MSIFARIRKLREFERKNLSHLRSIEDFDIVEEIGFHQENGKPLSPKQLTLLGIAPAATVQRRLSRLVALGVISKRYSREDGRIVELSISAETVSLYGAYSRLLQRLRKATTRKIGRDDGGRRDAVSAAGVAKRSRQPLEPLPD